MDSDIRDLKLEKMAILETIPKILNSLVSQKDKLEETLREFRIYERAIDEIEQTYGHILYSPKYYQQNSVDGPHRDRPESPEGFMDFKPPTGPPRPAPQKVHSFKGGVSKGSPTHRSPSPNKRGETTRQSSNRLQTQNSRRTQQMTAQQSSNKMGERRGQSPPQQQKQQPPPQSKQRSSPPTTHPPSSKREEVEEEEEEYEEEEVDVSFVEGEEEYSYEEEEESYYEEESYEEEEEEEEEEEPKKKKGLFGRGR